VEVLSLIEMKTNTRLARSGINILNCCNHKRSHMGGRETFFVLTYWWQI